MNHTETSSTGTKKCNGRTKPHVNSASLSSSLTVFLFLLTLVVLWHGGLASSLSSFSFSFSFSTSTVYSIDPMGGARQTLPTLVFGGESKDEISRDQNNNNNTCWREASKAREYYMYPLKYVGILLLSTESVCSISCSTQTFLLLLLAKTIQKSAIRR